MVKNYQRGAYSSLRTGRAYYPNSRSYRPRMGYSQWRPQNSYRPPFRTRGYQGKGKNFKIFAPLTWIAGFVVGATDFDDRIPAEVKVGVANGPYSGKMGGKVKQFGQGMCFGDLMQKRVLPMLGINIGNTGSSTTGTSGVNRI